MDQLNFIYVFLFLFSFKIQTSGVPPSVSKRISLSIHCKYKFIFHQQSVTFIQIHGFLWHQKPQHKNSPLCGTVSQESSESNNKIKWNWVELSKHIKEEQKTYFDTFLLWTKETKWWIKRTMTCDEEVFNFWVFYWSHMSNQWTADCSIAHSGIHPQWILYVWNSHTHTKCHL